MNIVLPRTFEPGTIPWEMISSGDGTEKDISKALDYLLDTFEGRKIMPRSSDQPTNGICAMLRETARTAGTDNVDALAYPIVECKKHVGFEYVVLYSLPNSKNLYNWSRKSWFWMYPS